MILEIYGKEEGFKRKKPHMLTQISMAWPSHQTPEAEAEPLTSDGQTRLASELFEPALKLDSAPG